VVVFFQVAFHESPGFGQLFGKHHPVDHGNALVIHFLVEAVYIKGSEAAQISELHWVEW
jgi:hypothetical protein